jgi:hypothetical protein
MSSSPSLKPGYLYVLIHPSDPELFKVGVTVRTPEERLAQHNGDHSQLAGRIAKETGQLWELKEFHAVPDPYYAESVFWSRTRFVDIPFRRGVEIERMPWPEVQTALNAAKAAGPRPPPADLPEHVYAYTAQIRRRLNGRGIALCGYVRSIISGKSDFCCINGHQWRTTPRLVGEGRGCPECGVGDRSPNDIARIINAGVVCLLTHPDKPGHVNVGAADGTLEEIGNNWPWDDWEMHRYRRVDNVEMAERIAWDLLSHPLPHDRQPIEKDLGIAEGAFRKLVYVMQSEFANEERRRARFEDLAGL